MACFLKNRWNQWSSFHGAVAAADRSSASDHLFIILGGSLVVSLSFSLSLPVFSSFSTWFQLHCNHLAVCSRIEEDSRLENTLAAWIMSFTIIDDHIVHRSIVTVAIVFQSGSMRPRWTLITLLGKEWMALPFLPYLPACLHGVGPE